MIAVDSPLVRIPLGLDPEQAMFFDGIRHAVEIAEFALDRLRHTLKELTDAPTNVEGDLNFARMVTSALLDAWTVIDASHRFVGLKRVCSGLEAVVSQESEDQKVTYFKCKKLRDLTDHLHGTIPKVLSSQGAAMGVLRWHTRSPEGLPLMCLLMPGTSDVTTEGINLEEAATWGSPLGPISLHAGDYSVYLDDLINSVEIDVRAIEAGLAEPYAALAPSFRAGDKLARIKMSTEPFPGQEP